MTRLYFVPFLSSSALLLLFSLLFSSCYTVKQGAALISYLNRAVPLEKLAELEGEKDFVERVERIRGFAMQDLGLKESKNYTRYVALERDYLASIVSACDALSFKRHTWWFPVVGSVPYKGFFNVDDAKKEAAVLKKRGLDVWIRGVDAFSTLGFFRDPLYSYMKDYSEERLADLIIHELLHATIYIKGDGEFNESLAEFVGEKGAAAYMKKYYGETDGGNGATADGAADSAADSRRDYKTFVDYIRALCGELEAVYSGGMTRDEKLAKKAEVIAASQARFEREYDGMFTTDNYRRFSTMSVNNAYLDLYRLYHEGENFFDKAYEDAGFDIAAFVKKAKSWKSRRDA